MNARILYRIPTGLARMGRAVNDWRVDRIGEDDYEAIPNGPAREQKREERRKARRRRTARLLWIAAAIGVAALASDILFGDHVTNLAAAGVVSAILLAAFAAGHSRPALTDARTPALTDKSAGPWGGSMDALQVALAESGVIKADQPIGTVAIPHKVGRGVQGVAQLPGGVSVTMCLQRRDRIAASLAVDSTYLQLGKGANDGQLKFWAPSGDPFDQNVRDLPLLDADRWNSWKPAPFAFTAQDKTVNLRLAYSNMLIGSKPGSGKTFAARCAAAPYILDPGVRIYVANGKPDGAWEPVRSFAVRYVRGRTDDKARDVDAMLAEVQAEMDTRFEAMGDASKVTEASGLSPILVVVDELQNYTTNSFPADAPLRGRKATLGDWIDYRLVDIIKNGRAAGVILIIVTQRPSEESLSTELRSQVGTRWAGKTMDHYTSNMILGNVSKMGVDASQIDPRHRGVGIFVPDADEDLADPELGAYPTVRTFLCDDDAWARMCNRGRELRGIPEPIRELNPPEPDPEPEPERALQAVPDYIETIDDDADLLEHIRAIWPDGADRAARDELAERLADRFPRYETWRPEDLTRELRARDIVTRPVRIDGRPVRGLYMADLGD